MVTANKEGRLAVEENGKLKYSTLEDFILVLLEKLEKPFCVQNKSPILAHMAKTLEDNLRGKIDRAVDLMNDEHRNIMLPYCELMLDHKNAYEELCRLTNDENDVEILNDDNDDDSNNNTKKFRMRIRSKDAIVVCFAVEKVNENPNLLSFRLL